MADDVNCSFVVVVAPLAVGAAPEPTTPSMKLPLPFATMSSYPCAATDAMTHPRAAPEPLQSRTKVHFMLMEMEPTL